MLTHITKKVDFKTTLVTLEQEKKNFKTEEKFRFIIKKKKTIRDYPKLF
jgi:hypothetical protein